LEYVPSSHIEEGRFGRLFRNVPIFRQDESDLLALGALMVSPREDDPTPEGQVDPEESSIPAGYTYVGQFVDHDLTFDPASTLDKFNDPNALVNFRSPRFDLDSVYGRGPDDQPYLYDQQHPDFPGLALLLGRDAKVRSAIEDQRDLPRNEQGRALLGDPRNDENIVVSQLHAAVIRFHNAMLERVHAEQPQLGHADLFKETQRQVRWHYQWAVFHDFLPRIVGGDLAGETLERAWNLRYYRPYGPGSFMPVEFSVAAYRFGHSMVRPEYRINSFVPPRIPIFSDEANPLVNLNGFRPLPDDWGFEWRFFFTGIGETTADRPMQHAYRIDTHLVNPLGTLPGPAVAGLRSLAQRNLVRGLRLKLPSGQAVARALRLPVLDEDELVAGGEDGETPIADIGTGSLRGNAPLWYYILRESELRHEGNRLGAVGGKIVAEVFVGLLFADRLSYLRVDPDWRPDEALCADGKTFGMADLLRFATGQQ